MVTLCIGNSNYPLETSNVFSGEYENKHLGDHNTVINHFDLELKIETMEVFSVGNLVLRTGLWTQHVTFCCQICQCQKIRDWSVLVLKNTGNMGGITIDLIG